MRVLRAFAAFVATGAVAASVLALAVKGEKRAAQAVRPGPPPAHATLSATRGSYVGLYRAEFPHSSAGEIAFAAETGISPQVIAYYSGWFEPFQTDFATTAAKHGAVPLVQINPDGVSLRAITAGRYDSYLTNFAVAVRAYRGPVIVSFGHEMNGWWFSWGYKHSSPMAFVAAWQHIVTLFRALGAGNVTWLWTINIIDKRNNRIPVPTPWWPGSSYVTWVGIDGYYYKSSWRFAPLFGPTIRAVRALSHAPILIAETGAAPAAGKPAKITDLFAGVRAYGLLGFVWFDAIGVRDWRIDSPAALAAFRRGAKTFNRPGS